MICWDDVVTNTHPAATYAFAVAVDWLGKPFSVSCQVSAGCIECNARWFVTYKSVKICAHSALGSCSCHLFDWTVSLFAQQSYLFLCKIHRPSAPPRATQFCDRTKLWSLSFASLLVVAYPPSAYPTACACARVVLGSAFPFRCDLMLAHSCQFVFSFFHLFPVTGAECIFNWLQISGRARKTEASAKEWNWILLLYRAQDCRTEEYDGIFYCLSYLSDPSSTYLLGKPSNYIAVRYCVV